jgi:hypothetical protein
MIKTLLRDLSLRLFVPFAFATFAINARAGRGRPKLFGRRPYHQVLPTRPSPRADATNGGYAFARSGYELFAGEASNSGRNRKERSGQRLSRKLIGLHEISS